MSKFSSVIVFGKFVTYKLVSLSASPCGRAYETYGNQFTQKNIKHNEENIG